MKSKYLISFLAIIAGLNISAKEVLADVVVEWPAGDNSANIQQAIDSGDGRVVITQADKPWIIEKPLQGQVKGVNKNDVLAEKRFIDSLFEIAV